jgi:hypothetical protein
MRLLSVIAIIVSLVLFANCKKSSKGGYPTSPYTYLVAGTHSFHHLDYAVLTSGVGDTSIKTDTSFYIRFVDAGTLSIDSNLYRYDSQFVNKENVLHFLYNGYNKDHVQQMCNLVFDRTTNHIEVEAWTMVTGRTDVAFFSSY